MRCQGLRIDQRIDHLDLDLDLIRPGDIVLGILPVHLVGEVCARLEEYWVEKRSTAPARQVAV